MTRFGTQNKCAKLVWLKASYGCFGWILAITHLCWRECSFFTAPIKLIIGINELLVKSVEILSTSIAFIGQWKTVAANSCSLLFYRFQAPPSFCFFGRTPALFGLIATPFAVIKVLSSGMYSLKISETRREYYSQQFLLPSASYWLSSENGHHRSSHWLLTIVAPYIHKANQDWLGYVSPLLRIKTGT